MKNLIVFLSLITSLLITSCSQDKVNKSLLPGVSGSAGEVLVIMEKPLWKSEPGKAFREVMMQDCPGLPQREPLFNLVNINRKAFTELFRIHRNIIITHITPKVQEAKVTVEYDKWAQPQMVIHFNAPSEAALLAYFEKNSEKILGLLVKAEKDRLTKNYKTYKEIKVIEQLEKSTGVHLTIPKGYTMDMDTNNFVWLSHETPEISQGIFVYQYQYTDSGTFNPDYLVIKRNEFLRYYVGGALDGSYMTTEMQVPPSFKSYNYNKQYTAELRGLWKVEGDFMGGPFMSLTRLDEKNQRVVTVEGYVYAPKYDKRNYMRQLEAILYSFDFVDEPEEEKQK